MEFTDHLDEYLHAKKTVDELREKYTANLYLYNATFNDYYYSEVERYLEARNRLNEFMNRKSLSEIRFGEGL